MKSLKKLTAIVLAMLMIMSMGVFSSFAVVAPVTDGTECECADGFVDAYTYVDGENDTAGADTYCDECGGVEAEEDDAMDWFTSIIADFTAFIQMIVDAIRDFVSTVSAG